MKNDFRASFKVPRLGRIVVIFSSVESNGHNKVKRLLKLFGDKSELLRLQKKVPNHHERKWFTIGKDKVKGNG